ncbi:MAG: hypothetical protein JSR54_12305, partial [Proteobacteria bacterium]|nr:hypothetical protein [Pseudomonadota bacterium]
MNTDLNVASCGRDPSALSERSADRPRPARRAGSGASHPRPRLQPSLITAAVSLVLATALRAANAGPGPCDVSGGTVTCTGDQSSGVTTTAPITTLEVRDLTTHDAGGVSLNGSGAGGAGGGSYPVTGGDGDAGGAGGPVTIHYSSGDVHISTVNQSGITAVSSGGAGGGGGTGVGITVIIPLPPFVIPLPGFGGDGGAGGAGGTVQVTSAGTIATSGDLAHGIYAESNGGNGGKGGDVISILSVYGEGGDGGNAASGGTVSVQNSARITTQGAAAQGIVASSTGGIGGAGGSVDGLGIVGVGGRGAAATNGGTVTVVNSGAITTDGAVANGILAQSIGGFGGAGGGGGIELFSYGGSGNSAGDGGVVSVTNSGAITTQQVDSRGVL